MFICCGIIALNLFILLSINKFIGKKYFIRPSLFGGLNGPDEYYGKILENNNSIVYDFIGIIGILIGYYLFEPVKWVLLAFFGLTFLLGAVPFVISLVLQITTDISNRRFDGSMWLVLASNFICAYADATIILATLEVFFN